MLAHLCEAQFWLNRFAEAEASCVEAVAIADNDASRSADHYMILATSLPWLALSLERQGKVEDALEVRERQLERIELGRRDLTQGVALWSRVGHLHLILGDRADAEAAFNEAIDLANRASPLKFSEVTEGYRGLAALYLIEERFGQAEVILLSAMDRMAAGVDKYGYASTGLVEALGWTRYWQGRFEESRALAQQAFEFHESKDDLETFSATTTKLLLARLADTESTGSTIAERLLISATEVPEEEYFAEAEAFRAAAWRELAAHYLLAGETQRAEEPARRALGIYATLLPELMSVEIARAHAVLARTLNGQGRYRDALPSAQVAYAAQRILLPAYSSETGETLVLLSELYEATGDRENYAAIETLRAEHRTARAEFESGN